MIREHVPPRVRRAALLYAAIWVGLAAFWLAFIFNPSPDPEITTIWDELLFAVAGPAVVSIAPALCATAVLEYSD